jgi:hypothetical protein
MPEAIAKYALNSTIGTSDFKPLDQIIEGQKSLVVSDNIYATLWDKNTYLDDGDLVKFKMNVNGSAKLKYYNVAISGDELYLQVFRNSTIVSNLRVPALTTERQHESDTFIFEKGDEITLTVHEYGTSYLGAVYLMADIIDGSALTILN